MEEGSYLPGGFYLLYSSFLPTHCLTLKQGIVFSIYFYISETSNNTQDLRKHKFSTNYEHFLSEHI